MKKETFRIECESISLMDSFKKELKKSNIELFTNMSPIGIFLFPDWEYTEGTKPTHFTLPQDWDKALDYAKKQAVEAKPKFNPKIGDWVAMPIGSSLFVFKTTTIDGDDIYGFGYDLTNPYPFGAGYLGDLIANRDDIDEKTRYATDSEIKGALIKICEHKELFDKKVKSPFEGGQEQTISKDSVFAYYPIADSLFGKGFCLYIDSEFAEPVEDNNYIMPELLNIKKDFDELFDELIDKIQQK